MDAQSIEQVIFDVASALKVPVLILALAALVAVTVELGRFVVELARRRDRSFSALEEAASHARKALATEPNREEAGRWLSTVAWSSQMGETLDFLARESGKDNSEAKVSKALADFDYRSLRSLERTRLLVRFGPALGLMGTLIPLSPALAGLASGDVNELTDNLRIAFSVTVLGLLVGAVAFGISLVRDRLYGQDLSDLQYVAATLDDDDA
jgi:biopolymer transport protein ExbB/TolQ